MSFLGKIFKKDRKKETPKAAEEKKADRVPEVSREPYAVRPAVLGVLRGPHITEKAAGFAKSHTYVFRVTAHANKPQVKKAVEARFGVHVEAVRMCAARRHVRMRGRIQGWKPGFRKAIVRIKEGEAIEAQ